jgi:PhnB protein
MTVTRMYPRLVVSDARAAIAFYEKVFGAAVSGEVHTDDSGKVVHSELTLGGTTLSVRDEGYGDSATPVLMALDVTDPDEVAAAMEAGGASIVYPISDHEYGRGGRLRDPWGIQWMLMRP